MHILLEGRRVHVHVLTDRRPLHALQALEDGDDDTPQYFVRIECIHTRSKASDTGATDHEHEHPPLTLRRTPELRHTLEALDALDRDTIFSTADLPGNDAFEKVSLVRTLKRVGIVEEI